MGGGGGGKRLVCLENFHSEKNLGRWSRDQLQRWIGWWPFGLHGDVAEADERRRMHPQASPPPPPKKKKKMSDELIKGGGGRLVMETAPSVLRYERRLPAKHSKKKKTNRRRLEGQ